VLGRAQAVNKPNPVKRSCGAPECMCQGGTPYDSYNVGQCFGESVMRPLGRLLGALWDPSFKAGTASLEDSLKA